MFNWFNVFELRDDSESEEEEFSEMSTDSEGTAYSEESTDSEAEDENMYNDGIYLLKPVDEGRKLSEKRISWSHFAYGIMKEIMNECQQGNLQIAVGRSLIVRWDLLAVWLKLIFDLKKGLPKSMMDLRVVDINCKPVRLQNVSVQIMTRLLQDHQDHYMVSAFVTCDRKMPADS